MIIIYDINYSFASHFGYNNVITGTITTDGTLGPLAPADILAWDTTLTYTSIFGTNFFSSNSETGDAATWTLNSLIAGDNLIFDFGPQFTSSLHIGTLYFTPGSIGQYGTEVGVTLNFTTIELHTLGTLQPVPGPVVGNGILGLLMIVILIFRRFK